MMLSRNASLTTGSVLMAHCIAMAHCDNEVVKATIAGDANDHRCPPGRTEQEAHTRRRRQRREPGCGGPDALAARLPQRAVERWQGRGRVVPEEQPRHRVDGRGDAVDERP